MTDVIVSALLTRCMDPGDSANKIKLPGAKLADLSNEQLYDYMRPWHSTLGSAKAVVLFDELPQTFIDQYNGDNVRFVQFACDPTENVWAARYRMFERWLADNPVDRVLFSDINDVAFSSNPFEWLDKWELPAQMVFGEELNPFRTNGWFSGDALKRMPDELAAFFRGAPETKPLSAGLWGGPAPEVLEFTRQLIKLLDQYEGVRRQYPVIGWDMILFNYLAHSTLTRFATFAMHLATLPHYLAGITLRWNDNPNAIEHNTQRSRAFADGRVSWNRGSPMCWEEIPGWFDFQRIYDEALNRAYLPSVFVEVGSWFGKSCAYMAQQIRDRRRKVDFYAVDTWKGSANQDELVAIVEERGGDLFPDWQMNMDRCNVLEYVTPIQLPSVEAAAKFPDGSIDFCFIDGDHGREAVKADIAAWLPKMKPNGVLAGHDYQMPEVRQAVKESGLRFRRWEKCWIVDPPH